jgi:hypothetical protein
MDGENLRSRQARAWIADRAGSGCQHAGLHLFL